MNTAQPERKGIATKFNQSGLGIELFETNENHTEECDGGYGESTATAVGSSSCVVIDPSRPALNRVLRQSKGTVHPHREKGSTAAHTCVGGREDRPYVNA